MSSRRRPFSEKQATRRSDWPHRFSSWTRNWLTSAAADGGEEGEEDELLLASLPPPLATVAAAEEEDDDDAEGVAFPVPKKNESLDGFNVGVDEGDAPRRASERGRKKHSIRSRRREKEGGK